MGDLESQTYTIAENSSIVPVDNQKYRTNLCQAIVSGGFVMGSPVANVLALNFDVVTKNAVESYVCNVVNELPSLPFARYMHQSVIIKGKTGSWTLFVAGGKRDARSWIPDVQCLDLLPYFRTGIVKTTDQGRTEAVQSQWKDCAPMSAPRANFALIALKNMIYAYGGISGSDSGAKSHYPTLADPIVERYVVASDSWEAIAVNRAPRLAAFSWCQLGDTAEIAIVGGTDGNIMSDESFTVNLESGTL